ncbi:unnamed protein product [Effrenium voratum]|uniref:RRM domain-containing protein n=1 Tax=Effrenium voratum TaxID=2562239 RepID=A0AA36MU63_9DINO|nr:unnamed protein product [Effrenium voratum]
MSKPSEAEEAFDRHGIFLQGAILARVSARRFRRVRRAGDRARSSFFQDCKLTPPEKGSAPGMAWGSSAKVLFQGLSPDPDADELKEFFESFGSVLDGRKVGSGCVTFKSPEAARAILQAEPMHLGSVKGLLRFQGKRLQCKVQGVSACANKSDLMTIAIAIRTHFASKKDACTPADVAGEAFDAQRLGNAFLGAQRVALAVEGLPDATEVEVKAFFESFGAVEEAGPRDPSAHGLGPQLEWPRTRHGQWAIDRAISLQPGASAEVVFTEEQTAGAFSRRAFIQPVKAKNELAMSMADASTRASESHVDEDGMSDASAASLGNTTSASSKLSKARNERDRGPKRAAKRIRRAMIKKGMCKEVVDAMTDQEVLNARETSRRTPFSDLLAEHLGMVSEGAAVTLQERLSAALAVPAGLKDPLKEAELSRAQAFAKPAEGIGGRCKFCGVVWDPCHAQSKNHLKAVTEHALGTRLFGPASLAKRLDATGLVVGGRKPTKQEVQRFWGDVTLMPVVLWDRLNKGEGIQLRWGGAKSKARPGVSGPKWQALQMRLTEARKAQRREALPDEEGTEKVYLQKVPKDWTEDQATAYYSRFGKVVELALPYDRDAGQLRGFGYVTFDSCESAAKAIAFAKIGAPRADFTRPGEAPEVPDVFIRVQNLPQTKMQCCTEV